MGIFAYEIKGWKIVTVRRSVILRTVAVSLEAEKLDADSIDLAQPSSMEAR